MNRQKLLPQHWITIVVFALVIMGVVVLSSASAIISYKNFGTNSFYFWNQLFSIVIGIIGWIVCIHIPYKKWIEYTPILFIIILALLVGVFIPGIGAEYGTSHSWINLPSPLPNIQPAEYAKLILILYLAFLFDRKKAMVSDFKQGYLPFAIITGVIVGLLALQPDFGGVLITLIIAGFMFYIAGGQILHIAGSVIVAGLLGLIVALNKPYIYDRFTAFMNPFQDELGTGYHIIQSLIAVGSGGFFGKGFGASRFKYEGYLPEAQGDSIFAIAAEELGFIRIIFIIIGFIIIAWQGFKIAERAKDDYGKYLAVGISVWIFIQAFINIMVVLSLFPTTGITLPFISYGGSSLLASLMGIGILLNIAKYGKESESRADGWRNSRSYYTDTHRSESLITKKRI